MTTQQLVKPLPRSVANAQGLNALFGIFRAGWVEPATGRG